jgi:hypothetical protein
MHFGKPFILLNVKLIMVFVELEPVGVAVIAAQITVFLLPLIGVLTEEKRENTRNLIKHGFFSTAALLANITMILVFMIPVFTKNVSAALTSSLFQYPIMWLHAVTGVVAVALSVAMVVAWVRQPLADLGCSKTWKLMLPTLIAWAVVLGLGVYVGVFGLS